MATMNSDMSKVTRMSLINALSHYSLPNIPDIDNGEDVWIRALALVTKYDGRDYFVCVEKDWQTFDNKVIKDFGATSAICKYKAIYPFVYLESRYMPNNLDKTKESRIAYLSRLDPSRDFTNLNIKELNKLILCYAVKAQLFNEKTNKYYERYYDEGSDGVEEDAGGDEGEDKD